MDTLSIRPIQQADIPILEAAFAEKPVGQYARYFAENTSGDRTTLVAFTGSTFVGYLNIVWTPDYPPFREAGIPEIQDFNVVASMRRQGFGSRLMDAAEAIVMERSPVVGIGVGLYADYGAAQRLYIRRGYIPDGQGACYDNKPVEPGERVAVDDSLTLQLTKRLRQDSVDDGGPTEYIDRPNIGDHR